MDTLPTPSLDALLRDASVRIDPTDARWLLAHAAGQSQTWVFAHATDAAPPALVARFETLVMRRVAGEPVAYLTGRRGFWSLDLAVTPDTLIPRPETELLVEQVLTRLSSRPGTRFVDLGTGSGAIALAVACERGDVEVIATDASVGALDVARANAAANALHHVEFRHGDWFAPVVGERFDVIASNPPYIADGDAHLRQGDLRFEPSSALSSGCDGLDAIRVLVAGAPDHLRGGGWLLLEHGFDQGEAIRVLLHAGGFAGVETIRDLEHRDRVTLGHLPPAGGPSTPDW